MKPARTSAPNRSGVSGRSKKDDTGTLLLKNALPYAQSQGIRRILIVTRKPLDWKYVDRLSRSIPIFLAVVIKMKQVPIVLVLIDIIAIVLLYNLHRNF